MTFQWAGGSGVADYFLFVGTTAGGSDILRQDEGSLTSATVNGLPTNGSAVYVRLWSLTSAGYQYNDYAYASEGGSCATATMTSPANHSVLSGSTVTFQWTAGTCVSGYYLYVGTALGASNILGQDEGKLTTAVVSGLPTDGSTVYVRLWSEIGGNYQSNDYTYTAAGTGVCAAATMTNPANHSALPGATVTFQWTPGTCVTDHVLSVGTSVGASDILKQDEGGLTSAIVSGLPTDGSTVYVRLASLIAGVWHNNDYSYTAAGSGTCAAATMISPANNSVLPGATATFKWTTGTCVTDHALYVGTSAGASDILKQDEGGLTSAVVAGLPTNGKTVYVRLWSQIAGDWYNNDYTYSAAGGGACAASTMSSPANHSQLPGATVTFQWTAGTCVTDHYLYVGTAVGKGDILAQDEGKLTSAIVSGLPTDGSTVYVRLWSEISGAYQYYDYTYTAAVGSSCAASTMTSPTNHSVLPGPTVTFQWTAGTCVTDHSLSIGTGVGKSDILGQDEGSLTSATVTGLPTNGSTIYVRLSSQIGGVWHNNDYTYTASTGGACGAATMTSPTNRSVLPGSTVTFQWTPGTCVTDHYLYIGTTVGASDILKQDEGSNTSAVVSGLPTDGSTVYVRLSSQIAGVWQNNDYTYAAAGGTCAAATMTSPAGNSLLPGATVTFQWTEGVCVTDHYLYIGTTAGGSDILKRDEGGLTSAVVSGLPTNGKTVYVRLWSLFGATFQYIDYTYTAAGGAACAAATMTSPANNTQLAGSTVTFKWTAGTCVTDHFLYIGTAVGMSDLFGQDEGSLLQATVSGLPTNGSKVYVRLWSQIAGTWQSNDYTYTAASK